jgi:hypothetical protein
MCAVEEQRLSRSLVRGKKEARRAQQEPSNSYSMVTVLT